MPSIESKVIQSDHNTDKIATLSNPAIHILQKILKLVPKNNPSQSPNSPEKQKITHIYTYTHTWFNIIE